MSDREPIFRKLYVGIRPHLKRLKQSNATLVYMYLLTRLDDRSGRCDPAALTIAAELGMDVKTVRNAFKVLLDAGVVRRQLRAGTTDNWAFVVFDIQANDETLPAKRVHPQNGYTHETGRPSTRSAGTRSTRETGTEEETIKEETKTEASGLAGADAPVVLPANECDEPEGYFSDDASGTPAAEQSVSEAGKAVGMNTAVPAKAKGKAAKVSKPKAQPLTDDEKMLACGSLAMMERWLLWGSAGLREMNDANLTPTATNWRSVNPGAETAEIKVKDWNTQHFAAYFWWQVSKHREARGLPITIPDFGRICASIVALRKTMTTWQVAQRIANVVAHFDLIRFELSWVRGLALNEGSLQDTNTTKLVTDIENSGEFVLTARYAKLQAASEAA